MSFIAPWALWFLLGIPVIILFYFLKQERRRHTVSSLFFWEQLLQKTHYRTFFQKLRRWKSLLLFLLIYLLTLLVLLHPEIKNALFKNITTVVLIDTRLPMQTTDAHGQPWFANAKKEAVAAIQKIRSNEKVAILTTTGGGNIIASFSDNQKYLLKSVRTLQATDSGGNPNDAIVFARSLLKNFSGKRKILFFTGIADDRISDFDDNLSVVAVGQPTDNIAITRFAVRRLPNSPETQVLQIEVRNYGKQTQKTDVEMLQGETLFDVKSVTLKPGEVKRLTYSEVFPENSDPRLTARIIASDALFADNTAYAVRTPLMRRRVLLVSKGNLFLENVLKADVQTQFEMLTPDTFRMEMVQGFDVVIFDNYKPEIRNFLDSPSGNFLFLGRTPFEKGKKIEHPLPIENQFGSHVVLQFINPALWSLFQAYPQQTEPYSHWKWTTLLSSVETPLLIAGEYEGQTRRRLIASAFGVNDTDLPLRVAFPLLITNSLQWLSEQVAENADAIAAGKAPYAKNGHYEIRNQNESHWIAVNTMDPKASDLQMENAIPSHTILHASFMSRYPWWLYVLLSAWGLLLAEWWGYHRRKTE